MPQQLIATMTPPASRAGSPGRGTVHSMELARRRLRRSTPATTSGCSSSAATRSPAPACAGCWRTTHGLAVVGEAASGRDGARLARSTDPDVVLLDAGRFEPELAASARLLAGRVAVLLLTECDPDDRVLAAIRAGATGVLAKDSHPAELASAVRTLAAGGALLPPRMTRRLITELVNTTPSRSR